jgi:hypothetical protein
MPLLRRTSTVTDVAAPAEPATAATLTPADLTHLRDEPDPDPLVEEAAERLRGAIVSLDARDEWGRRLPWRQVARIALGPVVTQLRDAQTAARLMAATQPSAPEPVEQRDIVLDVIHAMLRETHLTGDAAMAGEEPELFEPHAVEGELPTPGEMPFWPA